MIKVKRPTPLVQCLMPKCPLWNVNVNVSEVGSVHVCILQMFFKCVNFKSLSNLLQIFFKCLQIVFLYKDQRQTQSLSRCLLTDKHLNWFLAFLCWAILCCKSCQLQDKGEHGFKDKLSHAIFYQIHTDISRSTQIFQDLPRSFKICPDLPRSAKIF